MKHGLKIGLIAVGSLVAFVITVVCLACWLIFTPARLTGIVNKVADKYLDCEMSVGEIDLTLFSTLPNVSLQLSDVTLVNPMDSTANDTVAMIQHCQAVLDIKALISDQAVILRGLHMNGGWANLYTNAEGKANYMVFPIDTLDEDEVDTTAFKLPHMDIQEIDIRDMRVDYYDAIAGQKATVEGLAMHVNGQIMKEQLKATLNASLHTISVAQEGKNLMSAHVEGITLGVNGKTQNDEAQANITFAIGNIEALLPDMKAHVEQVEWTLDGQKKGDTWKGSTSLHTQPIAVDMEGETSMSATLPHVQFKANAQWQGKNIVVSPALTMPAVSVVLDGEQMVDKANIQIGATIQTDTLLKHVTLTQGMLTLNEHEINLKGEVQMPDTTTVDGCLSFETNRCDITRLLELVPQSLRYLIDGISISGGVALKGSGQASIINGQAHIGTADATLSLDNIDLMYNDSIALQSDRANVNIAYNGKRDHATGQLNANKLRLAMTGMADAQLHGMKGDFTMKQVMRVAEGNMDVKARFSMDELTATMDTLGLYTQEATMDLTLNANKNKKALFDAVMHLDTLHTNMGTLLAASTGELSLDAHAAYDETGGNILEQWSPKLSFDVMSGNVSASMLTMPVTIPHIQFDYTNGHFNINDSRILLGNSDFELHGDVHNIDSFINNTGLLKAEFDFTSAYTDVTQLMNLVSGLGATYTMEEETNEQTTETDAEDNPFMVPLGVDVRLNTDIHTVNVNGFKFDDIGGQLIVKDGVLVLEEMGFTSDAARMQLTAMYKSPRKNHLFVGFDFHLLDIEIDELIHMVPDVDSIIPMLSAFAGEAEFHLAGETYLKSNYDIKLSTLRAAAAIEGKDLVVMDNATFAQISKYLMFEKGTRNVVDSISVELTVFKDEVDLYPFLISMDDYQAVIGGRHNINEELNFNYHISLTSPLRLGLDIGGTLDNMKFKLVGCKYAQMYNPDKRNDVQARTLQLKKVISDSLKDNVKPQ